MKVAMVAAGFTAEEADQLRRAMAAWRHAGHIERFHRKIIDGMLANGYEREFAERCFNQIRGFGEYGFPESHAASFALLVYASAGSSAIIPRPSAAPCSTASRWVSTSRPRLSATPASMASPSAPSMSISAIGIARWNRTIPHREPNKDANPPGVSAARPSGSGFRLIKGMRVRARRASRRIPPPTTDAFTFRRAFSSGNQSPGHRHRMPGHRRCFYFPPAQTPHRTLADDGPERRARSRFLRRKIRPRPFRRILPAMPLQQEVLTDYATAGLSLKQHPLVVLREELSRRKIITAAELIHENNGWVRVAGLVLVRQRPGTASGVVFITLEDETGVANLIVRPDIFAAFPQAAAHTSSRPTAASNAREKSSTSWSSVLRI